LLQQTQPYNFILGVRDTVKAQAEYNDLKFDSAKHSVSILPLDLLNLKSVRSFATQALTELGQNKLDLLFLVAGSLNSAEGPGPHRSQWCESYVTNHLGRSNYTNRYIIGLPCVEANHYLAQHYLTHHLAETLAASKSRIVVVSSGAIRGVRENDPSKFNILWPSAKSANY
jgi:NAD(P)-dependent dehydrogenase (short-subunit alcohol dehydrogenase family)